MCHKSEVFIAAYKTHSCIHILKLDHSSKYIGNAAQEWMACHSIQHITAPTYSPKHNSITEYLTNWFWAKALNTVVYINNHMLSRSIDNKDPFQLLHGHTPDISKLQPFSCSIYLLTPVQMCNKLQDCSCEAVYLSLSVHSTHH
ncbi:gagpol polyprotein [Acanthamoeba castellanii str. Neff]|uniref:Gagpol polyprotein n=1 Tax=Acanthamoeba castellanii (strain ATCC 30010 / Neff) TaxID=1257118 RepID=L8HEF8_ACACF|nr:gagpol polyprotein [Acanthamoeba castellanii str. Neff]ELR23143.1 gagpol polyprotein [Acanthamoeba castellanii str. Neff]